jgi:hypothetical protein
MPGEFQSDAEIFEQREVEVAAGMPGKVLAVKKGPRDDEDSARREARAAASRRAGDEVRERRERMIARRARLVGFFSHVLQERGKSREDVTAELLRSFHGQKFRELVNATEIVGFMEGAETATQAALRSVRESLGYLIDSRMFESFESDEEVIPDEDVRIKDAAEDLLGRLRESRSRQCKALVERWLKSRVFGDATKQDLVRRIVVEMRRIKKLKEEVFEVMP